jgi:hypothetical protein
MSAKKTKQKSSTLGILIAAIAITVFGAIAISVLSSTPLVRYNVSAQEYGTAWPFSNFESGIVNCYSNSATFSAEGVEYAINVSAKREFGFDYPEEVGIILPGKEGNEYNMAKLCNY